jgi:MFS transporter, PAT family, beta-lactamase induction signal transducer AmpG
MMKCPACENELVEKSYRGDIHVDECVSCHGVWFDKGELDAYRTAVEIQDRGSDFPAFQKKDESESRICQKCVSPLLIDGEVRQILLARCEQCHGYFVAYDQLIDIRDARKPDLMPIGPTILDMLNILSIRF